MADEYPIDVVLRAKDEMSKTLDDASGRLGKMAAIGSALGTVAGTVISGGLSLVAEGISSVVKAGIDGNAQFETYNTQFAVMLGSADAAKKRLEDLAKFGATTPFELPQVVEADKIIQGFGLHSEEAKAKFGFSGEEIRRIAGDVASGTGADFSEMSLLIGKFSAGATGEAISRMIELGITNREELAKMGLEFSKSGELVSPLPQSMEVVLGLMKEKYGGMMDAQSSTFEGMVSNLQDWVGATIREVGQPIFEILSDALKELLAFLNEPATQAAIKDFAKGMADALKAVVAWVKENWPAISAVIQTVFTAIKSIWESILKPALEAIVPVVKQIIDWVIANWPAFSKSVEVAFEAVKQFWEGTLKPAIDGIVPAINSIVNLARAAWSNFTGNIEIAFNNAKRSIIDPIQAAIDWIGGLGTTLSTLGNNIIGGIISGITNAPGSILRTLDGIVQGAIYAIKRSLGIASPSKVFAGIGENMMLGLAQGIEAMAGVPRLALGQSMAGVTGGFGNSTQYSNTATVSVVVNGGNAESVQNGIYAGLYQAGFGVTR